MYGTDSVDLPTQVSPSGGLGGSKHGYGNRIDLYSVNTLVYMAQAPFLAGYGEENRAWPQ